MVKMPRYYPIRGEWFYGAVCPTCGLRVPFTMDPDDGEGEFALAPGWIEMTCDQGHTHRYRASEMQRWLCE